MKEKYKKIIKILILIGLGCLVAFLVFLIVLFLTTATVTITGEPGGTIIPLN